MIATAISEVNTSPTVQPAGAPPIPPHGVVSSARRRARPSTHIRSRRVRLMRGAICQR